MYNKRNQLYVPRIKTQLNYSQTGRDMKASQTTKDKAVFFAASKVSINRERVQLVFRCYTPPSSALPNAWLRPTPGNHFFLLVLHH